MFPVIVSCTVRFTEHCDGSRMKRIRISPLPMFLAGTCFALSGPTYVNCPYDNAVMNATGQSRIGANGSKTCEYAHETTAPTTPQPYDPKNPQPYKAPRVVRHTAWVGCSQ